MAETPCLKVPKKMAEKAIRLVNKLKLTNHELKIQQIDNHLYIPITHEPSPTLLEEIRKMVEQLEVTKHNFPKRTKHPLKLLELLEEKMPQHLLARVPRAIDFVGDIAIVEIPPDLANQKKTIGEAILEVHKQTSTVLGKSGAVEGIYRLRDFEVIAGVKKTITVHRENGCSYHVDIAKAYFSPRLSNEHNRVASQVEEGETVIDLFAGVGSFSILTAKIHEGVRIYAVDVNPDAIALLKKNIAVNRVEARVVPILGEARWIVGEKLMGVADRVIMNLPETAIEYVDVACDGLRAGGGIIHYYEFTKELKPLETATVRLTEAVSRSNRKVKRVLLAKKVREVAPHTWQVVVDAKIQ